MARKTGDSLTCLCAGWEAVGGEGLVHSIRLSLQGADWATHATCLNRASWALATTGEQQVWVTSSAQVTVKCGQEWKRGVSCIYDTSF